MGNGGSGNCRIGWDIAIIDYRQAREVRNHFAKWGMRESLPRLESFSRCWKSKGQS
jgi:hypothetical protein